jgi:hypothetical protein
MIGWYEVDEAALRTKGPPLQTSYQLPYFPLSMSTENFGLLKKSSGKPLG